MGASHLVGNYIICVLEIGTRNAETSKVIFKQFQVNEKKKQLHNCLATIFVIKFNRLLRFFDSNRYTMESICRMYKAEDGI